MVLLRKKKLLLGSLGGAVTPRNISAPVVLARQVGDVVAYWPGTWSGSPTVAHQFKLDGSNVADGYTLVSGDIGKSLTITETATYPSIAIPITGTGVTVTAGAPALPTPVLIDDFEANTGYTPVAGATLALDTTPGHFVRGSASMQVTAPGSGASNYGLKKTYGSVDPTVDVGTVALFWNRSSAASTGSIGINLSRGATQATIFTSPNDGTQFLKGGRFVCAGINEFPTVKAAGVGAIGVQPTFGGASPFNGVGNFDALYFKANGRPTLVWGFDDCYDSQFLNALAVFQKYGFVANVFVPPGLIGTPGKMTLAQLLALRAAGWGICCDSYNDVNYLNATAYPNTPTDQVADMKSVRQWLIDNGLSGAGEDHWCWPNGAFSQTLADAFAAEGFKIGRTSNGQSAFTRFGIGLGHRQAFPSFQANTTSGSVAAFIAKIDLTIDRGETFFAYSHDIQPTPFLGWKTTELDQGLAYVKSKWDQNLIDVLRVDQLWARDGGSSPP